VDDDTIGENIDGLPSVPSGYYGSGLIFEYFPDDEMIIGNFDIRHAWDAAYVSETTLFLYYSVFRNCSVGFQLSYATVYLSGVELCSVGTPSSSSSSYLYGSFMTCGQDSDSDGLPDMWEYQYFEDNLAQTGSGDYDGDGLTNQEEYELGLNPVVNDTAQLGSRLNYSYDATGRLQGVSGVRSEAVTSDGEGNIQGISQ
jgi:hypothetical protein